MALGYQIKHRGCGGGIGSFFFPHCDKCGRNWSFWGGLWTTDYYWTKANLPRKKRKIVPFSQMSWTRRLVFFVLLVGVCIGLYLLGIWIQGVAR